MAHDVELLLSNAQKYEESSRPWDRIEELLQEALEDASTSSQPDTERNRVEAERRRLRTKRNKRIENELARIRAELKKDTFDLTALNTDLDNLLRQTTRQEQNELIESLRDEANTRYRDVVEKREYEALRLRVDDLMVQAQRARQSRQYNEEAITRMFYYEAVKLVEDSTSSFRGESRLLNDLKSQVTAQYNEARRQADILTTAMQLGQYEELLEELEEIERLDPHRMVEKRDEKGISQGSAPVSDVIEFVRERAYTATEKKIRDEYQKRAFEHLEHHNPREAQRQMQIALRMKFVNDTARKLIEDTLENDIRPDLELLEYAERKINEAENAPVLQEALRLLSEARDTWQWVPGLVEARQGILSRMASQVESLLDDADLALQHGNIIPARNFLQQAEQFIGYETLERYAPKIRYLRAESDEVERENQATPAKSAEIRDLLAAGQFQDAAQILAEFRQQFPNALGRQPELAVLHNRIDARINVAGLKQSAENLLGSGNLAQMAQVLEACRTALRENKAMADQFDLASATVRLEGHYQLLLGQQAWYRNDATTAGDLLRQVVNNTLSRLEDQRPAQELLKQVDETIRQDARIDAVIKRVNDLLGRKPDQAELVRAYKELSEFRDKPTAHLVRFEQVFMEVGSRIEKAALDSVQNALKVHPIDLDTLEVQWSYLSDLLDSAYAPGLEKQSRLAIAAERGNRAYKAKHWAEAAAQYRIAFGLNPADDLLRDRYRQSRRLSVQSAVSLGLNQPLPRYEELIALTQDYEWDEPDEPIASLLLAEVLIAAAREKQTPDAFRDTVEMAYRAHQRAGNLLPPEANERNVWTDLGKQIESGRQMADTLLQSEARLVPDRELRSFYKGVQDVEDLLKTIKAFTGIQQWWVGVRQKLITTLIENVNRIDSVQYWKRFTYLTKLSQLDPDSRMAAEVRSAATRIPELLTIIADVIEDRTGTTYQHEASRAVDLQTKYVGEVDRYIRDLEEAIDLGLLKVDQESLEHVSRAHKPLSEKIGELQSVQQIVTRALGHLAAARRRDSEDRFNPFEAEMTKLTDCGYGAHIIVNHLYEKRAEYIQRREQLLDWGRECKTAFQEEDFTVVLDGLDRLGSEPDIADYAILENLRVEDSYRQARVIIGAKSLREEAFRRLKQLEINSMWLERLVDTAPLANLLKRRPAEVRAFIANIPSQGGLSLAKETHIVNPEGIHVAARSEAENSRFESASRIIKQHLQPSPSALVPELNPVPLMDAQAYLDHPPAEVKEPLSHKAAALDQLTHQLRTEVRSQIQKLRDYAEQLGKEEQQFEERLKQFDHALDQLVRGKAKGEDAARLVDQARIDFEFLHKLVPQYSGLMPHLDDYPVLKANAPLKTGG